MGHGARPTKAKVEARSAVTRKSRKLDASTGLQLKQRLAEALEQHAAISAILKVISASPSDVQPVLDTVAESATRLCGSSDAEVFRRDGDRLRLIAHHGTIPSGPLGEFTVPLVRDSVNGRATLNGQTIHVVDVQAKANEFPVTAEFARRQGSRTQLIVPMLRHGVAIGTISLRRTVVDPFTERQIALLTTFADEAVIAIENVRLFNETKEALEQQTATSEVLRVISQSPTDVQPVFGTIAAAALKLCSANVALVTTFDGELIRLASLAKLRPEGGDGIRNVFPRSPGRDTAASRAILTGNIVHIPDVLEDPEYTTRAQALAGDFRSILALPLLREGIPLGAISVGRPDPGLFPDTQIALLKTFADQAVIAIENVRLFTELRERTAQLTRSVDELTALGQVSQALSSTLDLEAVLTTIVRRAIELSGADGGSVYEYYDALEEFRLRATQNFEEELVEASRAMPLRRGEGALGLLAEQRAPIQIADIADPAAYQSRVREVLLRTGYRAILAIPLLRDDVLVGALVIGRKSAGHFPSGVIALLTTFANQSALAIQNARLFREIEEKGRELEAASRHKSEFLANMSHELRTPLNAIIGFSEVLSERMFGEINEKQAEYIGDILQSGQHLLSLINDILDLSKIEAGRMELELSDFDLPGTIENTLTLVRERAVRRGIALERTVDERLGVVRADERKVKQALLNLLSNALKFTPEGGRIDVRAAVRDSTAEISVADTGVGIAPEDQDTVFEEFRQVGTAAKKVEGTGLGLAISRKFIELHGGRIWVKSQVGAGSTFLFTLPLQ